MKREGDPPSLFHIPSPRERHAPGREARPELLPTPRGPAHQGRFTIEALLWAEHRALRPVLDRALFVEHDQVVLPALNLKTAKTIVCRSDRAVRAPPGSEVTSRERPRTARGVSGRWR